MTPDLWAVIIQIGIFLSYIPITFIAYMGLRAPAKRRRTKWELSLLGSDQTKEFNESLGGILYTPAQYLLPLTYIFFVLAALYGMTQPAVIRLHFWDGLLENSVNVFGLPAGTSPLDITYVTGRFMFWCWLGAYIHSVDRTIRHYLAHDLSPAVYIFSARRFIVAFVLGSLVGLGVGSLAKTAGVPFDQNLTMTYVVTFSIGLFPDQGTRWIVSTANKVMRQKSSSEQKPLSMIDGISDWQQGRLDQEGIVNVQNLATATLPPLVAGTPFDVSQIIDWVDQAILITKADPDQLAAVRKVGLSGASNVLQAAEHSLPDLSEATGLSEKNLELLSMAIKSTTNIDLIIRFHKNAKKELLTNL